MPNRKRQGWAKAIAKWGLPSSSSRPKGAADCSHGWSGAAAKPPDAQPVEAMACSSSSFRPEGAEEA